MSSGRGKLVQHRKLPNLRCQYDTEEEEPCAPHVVLVDLHEDLLPDYPVGRYYFFVRHELTDDLRVVLRSAARDDIVGRDPERPGVTPRAHDLKHVTVLRPE